MFRKRLFISFIITIFTFLLSGFVIIEMLNASSILPSDKSSSLELSDLYFRVSDKQNKSYLSKDVLVVATDGCSRKDIAQIIDALSFMEASTIGVDIIFKYETQNDSVLVAAVNNYDGSIVFAYDLNNQLFSDSNVEEYPIYGHFTDARYGFINFFADNQDIIRTSSPFVKDGIELKNSFTTEIVECKDSNKFSLLLDRNGEDEMISFLSKEFLTIYPDDLFIDGQMPDMEYGALIKDKIVLLGDINELSDLHKIPTGEHVPGIYIHAYTLETILKNSYINQMDNTIVVIIAFVWCLLFSYILIVAKEQYSAVDNMLIRFIQILSMYIFFVVGYHLFIKYNYYIDFLYIIMMTGLCSLVYEFVLGIQDFYSKVKPHFK